MTGESLSRESTLEPHSDLEPAGPRTTFKVICAGPVSRPADNTCINSLLTKTQNGGTGTCARGPTVIVLAFGSMACISVQRPRFTVTAGVGFKCRRTRAPIFTRSPHAVWRV